LKMKLITVAGLSLVCLLFIGCIPAQDFDAHLSSIVKPYRFSILKWESGAIWHELSQPLSGGHEKADDELQTVTEYFNIVKQIKSLKSEGNQTSHTTDLNRLQERQAALEETIEKIISKQIRETLNQQGIFNPTYKYTRLKTGFPPINFTMEKPPHLLVVSPRDRIESIREITLVQNLGLEEMEATEAEVDKLGVSSLVVDLGGLGATFPTFVTNDASLRFTIDTATEEWLHQYLAFKPLGFRYVLDLTGIARNYEIATMNETVAGMVSKEIGVILYERYYSQYENNRQNDTTGSGFDFNREMREIRKAVDSYLSHGDIEQAEEFMEQKRQYLVSKGYYIRKLNQAYFAFHGAYADRPTSIDPIGVELRELRSKSASLEDFLETVSSMTSHQELSDTLNKAAAGSA